MQGVIPETAIILEKLSCFNCIKEYIMIGGTALSLQIHHRLSEDIDFCRWRTRKNEKLSVHCAVIEEELSQIGAFKKDMLADYQVDYFVNGVKITFFCDNKYKQPKDLHPLHFYNNIRLADINSIGIMKLDVMLRRSKFRDYYDVYSIIKAGGNFNTIVNGVLQYNNHQVRSRDILSMLADGTRFSTEMNLTYLSPQYSITPRDVENFIMPYIKNYNTLKAEENKFVHFS